MADKVDFRCPYDCPFVELENRVCRDLEAPRSVSDKSLREIREDCEEKRMAVLHEYGIDTPCGYAAELVVKDVVGESF